MAHEYIKLQLLLLDDIIAHIMSYIEDQLRDISFGETSSEKFKDAAESLSQQLLRSRILLLDRRNIFPDEITQKVLQVMEAESDTNAYTTYDARPVRYVSLSVGTGDLVSIMEGSNFMVVETLMDRANLEPMFLARFDNPNNIRRELESKNKRFAIKLRLALRHFGNPPNYPIDDLSINWFKETDPSYPMLVPLFNIHFDHAPTGDPLKFYDTFNQMYHENEAKLSSGHVKPNQIFTNEQIVIARESHALVDFIDGILYQTFGLPKTTIGIAAPLFPYDAIAERYGYNYEAWLGFGPNDELMDSLRGAIVEPV